ncbi:hypothetical protein K2X89_14035 [Myxococcota bacterium]|nr:hypothetical protein [Myxococcota bacterium]
MQLPKNFDDRIKGLSALGGAIAFCWGVFQFTAGQQAQSETRRIEATRPFLERQLKLYTEATQAAATLSTSKDSNELDASRKTFWLLYWGELALVEDKKVEAAMVQFGDALRKGSTEDLLQEHALTLAHACRDSLAESWGVKEWRTPSYRTQ